MKEETEKEKESFFAQYYGQNLFEHNETPNSDTCPVGNALCLSILHGKSINGALLLKDLKNISDEDAIEVVNKCLGLYSGNSYLIEKGVTSTIFYAKISNHSYSPMEKEFGCSIGYLPLYTTDILRSKGYALPFRQYSVEQMVELKWIRIESI